MTWYEHQEVAFSTHVIELDDNDFMYLFAKPMLPLFLGIKGIPPTIVLFSTYSKTIISFLSPLKTFCFDRIELRNELSGLIMIIIMIFGDQIRHIALQITAFSLCANVGLARRLTRRLARRLVSAHSDLAPRCFGNQKCGFQRVRVVAVTSFVV